MLNLKWEKPPTSNPNLQPPTFNIIHIPPKGLVHPC